ncbi:conserved hypothetical protein [Leishmania major strain Friedlin]|uniref:Uncharacterized protein n=1 Tax=Leishmania major TaxID=5664 RepID=Q4QE31_LEIMA|nr:conserved hypothetical protein [Leishmania major strain Friedlin]CAG9572394.1 Protein_of_unknown_function_(DUF726)_-_putative [Leishmania major strain Friedlin]CAJ03452.1 conserved hypothetical protein [Leishmania major strain Friedlin]|eukprot:XP_001682417.1 conserved hypothetical protein [Leishmania major strain Friedlin]
MDTKAAQRSAYSFFDSYRYLWGPQRPQRTAEEMERLRGSVDAPAAEVLSFISFEDRVAIRSLFYVVVDDTNLRNLLDGLLLPPPYTFPDLHQKRWTQEDVRALCVVLNPSLDWVVVNVPFNLALRLGSYDARLRAAARRLSWILSIPFSLVEREENSLAQVHMTVSRDAAAEQADVARQEGLLKSKEQQKRSLMRAATIGGFSVLGGAALLVTGGLAAPVVGPAYAALVSATATTLGVIGAVGGAVLGTGALATVFATIVGAATHAAALASVVTPMLTAANMTAIFGVTGASLGGYKAFRRTTDSDIFMLRSVDEIEAFETAAAPTAALATTAEEEEADLNKEVVHRLACSQQTVEKGSGTAGTSWDLSVVLEDNSKPGVVVPSHTRMITMSHVRNLSLLQKRRRHVVFAVENNLDGFQLRLKAIKLISGVWAMAPPAVIAPARAGVFACVNRFAHPTGTGFIICYMATPSPGTANLTSLRIWVRAERDFFGAWALSAACEKTDLEFDPMAAENWMEGHLAGSDFTRRQWGVVLEMHVEPYTYLKLYPASAGEAAQARKVTFPKEELPQRQLEYGQKVKQRRKLGVSLVNCSSHDVFTRDAGMISGEQWPETPSPIGVYPAEASLTYFTNSEWSLAGAEGYYIVEVVNRSSRPVTPRFYVRANFAVSSLNNVNVAFASAYNLSELTRQSLTPATPSRAQFSVDLPPGIFFSLTCVVDVAHYAVQLVFQDFVERLGSAGVPATEKMTLAIGVSGYSAIFDPRRPVRDQQVCLWQSVLRRSELLGSTESYVLQWEDDMLMKFGETIHVNLEIADTLMMKAVSTATENTLMQGALFTGLHALSSLVHAFKLPLFAVWATSVIDNTFATLSNRSAYTGKDLAVALLDKQRGNRPVTLVGFSFGSLVIVECLRELERVEAYGVVENVYLLGCTCSSDPGLWHCLRRVVAGRLVNVYTREDWTLWMMYRLNKTDLKPMAGINPVNVPGVENVDVTPLVSAHGDFAVKLLPVLSAIPPEPTSTTWSPRQHHGSPGVTVPVRNCRETVAAVCKSLHSYIKATTYVAVGVKNCVVSDIPHYEPQVELLTVQVYGCFFDFVPPPLTDIGMASVAGLLGDTEKPMGAVVAYRMRLPPSSPQDLVVALYLCSSAKGDLQVCAQPNLVGRWSCAAETQEQAYQRLCAITAETCQTLDDVKRMCCTHGAEWELSSGATHTQSILVPVPNTFDDAHQTAIVRLALERLDSAGVTVTWLALLTRASTHLQQETFDETQFKTAVAAIGTHHPHHQGDGNGMPLPVVAETCSTDNLQQRLHSLAAQLQDPAKHPSNTAPFVLVNCGTLPLYFSETFHNAAKVAAVPDVPSCIWSMPQWRRFPPPEIPPRSFAVALLTLHDAEPGTHPAAPPVRYETNNGQCAFDVEFSDKIFTNGGAQGGADLAAAVHCTPVEGRPYRGEVTLSSTTIQATPFIIIMMVPRTAADAAVDVEDAQDTVESRLRAHGWYVM